MPEREYIYTAEDFERYYKGQMTPAEMNALEKTALEDPFLADALEGYAHSENILQDKEELQNRMLDRESGTAKSRNLFASPGLKIAAIFIIFAGLCWILYRNNDTSETELANTKPDDYKNSPIASAAPKDTLRLNPQTVDTQGSMAMKSNNGVKTRILDTSMLKHTAKDGVQTVDPAVIASAKAEQKDIVSAETETKSTLSKETQGITTPLTGNTVLKGRITDGRGEPVPFATVMDKNTNQATSADNAGTYMLVTKDTTPLITVTALGYETYTHKFTTDSSTYDIVLRDAGLATSEVVVTSAYKKKANLSSQSVKQVAESDSSKRVTLINVTPAMGWPAFNTYVSKKLKTKQQLGIESAAEIKIGFGINTHGEVKDISPAANACKQCKDEAIAFLKGAKFTLKDKKVLGFATFRFQ